MSHIVLARKYRPNTFSEVVFQEPVTITLQNAIQAQRIAHAYLFGGPRGVGKTSMARILAKSLNCLEGPGPSPCGRCQACKEISGGNSMDVIEIDGASNNSVDNIRDLRENVKFAPVLGPYKIYIIDEVHMLTQSAFNALLKTLEEPPGHIIFILATTEVHKIPATILSRCQQFQFRRIPIEDIVTSLQRITEKEGYRIDRKALFWIARQSEGSMRDAQSILEQMFSFGGGGSSLPKDDKTKVDIAIPLEKVKELLGVPDFELYKRILHHLKAKEPEQLLSVLRGAFISGLDTRRFVQGLLDFIRVLLLVSQGIKDESILQFPAEELEGFQGLLDNYNGEDLYFLFDQFRTLPEDFRFVIDDRALVEVAFLKAMDRLDKLTVSDVLDQLSKALGSDKSDNEPGEEKFSLGSGEEDIKKKRDEREIIEEKAPPKVAPAQETSLKKNENQNDKAHEESDSGPGLFDDALKIFDGLEITKKDQKRFKDLWELSNS